MRLRYLPFNLTWVFLFGDDFNTATIQPMGDYGRFFSTRKEAVQAARECKLGVGPNGNVYSLQPEEASA